MYIFIHINMFENKIFLWKRGRRSPQKQWFINYVGSIVPVIVWWFDLQLPAQSVPITTKVVSSNLAEARCTRYNNMLWSLSVICDRSVVFSGYSGFLHQLNWPPRYNWHIAESALNTIYQPTNQPTKQLNTVIANNRAFRTVIHTRRKINRDPGSSYEQTLCKTSLVYLYLSPLPPVKQLVVFVP